jgi:two-component system, LuxR family, response regulator FixJ
MHSGRKLALVDDDDAVRSSILMLLTSHSLLVQDYASGAGLLRDIEIGYQPEVIVSDVRMPGMSGTDLHEELKRRGVMAPVVLITGHGQVSMAVRALKAGAADFIEKPFEESVLLNAISRAVEAADKNADAARRKSDLMERVNQLTARQRQVMARVVLGHSSKEIAAELGISPRTVETYRLWVMEKMGATSTAMLIRMSMLLEQDI